MKLWLDDVRPPWLFGRLGWQWVRNYEEAVSCLATGTVEQASLDHDLSVEATLGQYGPDEKTGYSVVCWMEEHGVWPPKGVSVHGCNPVGSLRMQQVIDRHYENT